MLLPVRSKGIDATLSRCAITATARPRRGTGDELTVRPADQMSLLRTVNTPSQVTDGLLVGVSRKRA